VLLRKVGIVLEKLRGKDHRVAPRDLALDGAKLAAVDVFPQIRRKARPLAAKGVVLAPHPILVDALAKRKGWHRRGFLHRRATSWAFERRDAVQTISADGMALAALHRILKELQTDTTRYLFGNICCWSSILKKQGRIKPHFVFVCPAVWSTETMRSFFSASGKFRAGKYGE
jgi:hypothetical protein